MKSDFVRPALDREMATFTQLSPALCRREGRGRLHFEPGEKPALIRVGELLRFKQVYSTVRAKPRGLGQKTAPVRRRKG
ncbi:MAG: hypothetical protein WEB53_00395 [Akkermansiaceae bacterium]